MGIILGTKTTSFGTRKKPRDTAELMFYNEARKYVT